jgi:PhoPQ-activated pathogenicity-related protein
MTFIRTSLLATFTILAIAANSAAQSLAIKETLPPKPFPTAVNTSLTPLDEYVAAPDESFAWKIVHQEKDDAGNQALIISFTSQTWQPSESVNRTKWEHVLELFVPATAKTHIGLLFIDGGNNDQALPEKVDEKTRLFALAAGAVVAKLKCVPNQPLSFAGESRQRREDSIIAYTWDKYLDTGEANWILQLPMTKSAVKAMDAVTAVTESLGPPVVKVDQFVVAGASKRGWTTWLTAAVDKRVVAIAPIVIDLLNIDQSLTHHYACYGDWSEALNDYVEAKIPQRREDPRYRQLLQIVDPAAYRERLTMPKCIINSAGDEFFVPDSSQFYFDDLPGEKYLAYFPNCGHALKGSNALNTLIAFFSATVQGKQLPHVEWTRPEPDILRVSSDQTPTRVLLWSGNNPQARDFRLPVAGKCYHSQPLESSANNTWTITLPEPEVGWTASFVQLEFDIGTTWPFCISTPIVVLPEELPFADKPISED